MRSKIAKAELNATHTHTRTTKEDKDNHYKPTVATANAGKARTEATKGGDRGDYNPFLLFLCSCFE